TFVRAAGLIFQVADPEHVEANVYYAKEKVRIDWQVMLVIGIFVGALISSLMDKSFRLERVPPTWEQRFGPSLWKRAIGAFGGGVIALLRARVAAGCPSGHGLRGRGQHSVSALVGLTIFFIVGVLVAHLV